jgi:hypothetical protein
MNDSRNYWQRIANKRISRRRAVALTGGSAAAAAFLAACGGGDDDSGGGESRSSLTHTPVDTSGQGKPGGSILHYATTDIEHFDAVAANTASTVNLCSVYA